MEHFWHINRKRKYFGNPGQFVAEPFKGAYGGFVFPPSKNIPLKGLAPNCPGLPIFNNASDIFGFANENLDFLD